MSRIWFTSDLHLNHTNIAGPSISSWKNGYRDFKSVTEMNETILKNLNKYVQYDDVLYFLGDLCFKTHRDTPKWRSRIDCGTIHCMRGNHDPHIDLYKDSFSSLNDTLTIEVENGQIIFMSHYAHRVWNHSHKGVIHLYGHSHGSIPDHGKSMDVGIDVAYRMYGEYRPFSLEEILSIMNKKEAVDIRNR